MKQQRWRELLGRVFLLFHLFHQKNQLLSALRSVFTAAFNNLHIFVVLNLSSFFLFKDICLSKTFAGGFSVSFKQSRAPLKPESIVDPTDGPPDPFSGCCWYLRSLPPGGAKVPIIAESISQ